MTGPNRVEAGEGCARDMTVRAGARSWVAGMSMCLWGMVGERGELRPGKPAAEELAEEGPAGGRAGGVDCRVRFGRAGVRGLGEGPRPGSEKGCDSGVGTLVADCHECTRRMLASCHGP